MCAKLSIACRTLGRYVCSLVKEFPLTDGHQNFRDKTFALPWAQIGHVTIIWDCLNTI